MAPLERATNGTYVTHGTYELRIPHMSYRSHESHLFYHPTRVLTPIREHADTLHWFRLFRLFISSPNSACAPSLSRRSPSYPIALPPKTAPVCCSLRSPITPT